MYARLRALHNRYCMIMGAGGWPASAGLPIASIVSRIIRMPWGEYLILAQIIGHNLRKRCDPRSLAA